MHFDSFDEKLWLWQRLNGQIYEYVCWCYIISMSDLCPVCRLYCTDQCSPVQCNSAVLPVMYSAVLPVLFYAVEWCCSVLLSGAAQWCCSVVLSGGAQWCSVVLLSGAAQ